MTIAPAQQEDATAIHKNKAHKPVRRVHFDTVEVVEFEPSVWTASVASDGIPLGSSMDVRRRTKHHIDTFEDARAEDRIDRQEFMDYGYLESEDRLDVLENAGISFSVLSMAEKEMIRINRERWESNEYDMSYQFSLGEAPLGDWNDEEDGDDDELMILDDSEEEDELDDYMLGSDDDDNGPFKTVAYDTLPYNDLHVDYGVLLPEQEDLMSNQLPYAKESFESPEKFDLDKMATSPSDITSTTDCMIIAYSAQSKTENNTDTNKSAVLVM